LFLKVPLGEGGVEEENSLDMDDDLSENLSSDESGGSQDCDEVSMGGSLSQKSKKVVVARGKRAACWEHFDVVVVKSKE
jgi:hypothetical protein